MESYMLPAFVGSLATVNLSWAKSRAKSRHLTVGLPQDPKAQ